jgi:hypothetical protein
MGSVDAKALKPDGGMQMWYYKCPRIFRYPIPTNFEFAFDATIANRLAIASTLITVLLIILLRPRLLDN